MIRMELCKRLNFKWIRLPAGVGMGLGGHPAATTASDATQNGEALGGVVVMGCGLDAIADSISQQMSLDGLGPFSEMSEASVR